MAMRKTAMLYYGRSTTNLVDEVDGVMQRFGDYAVSLVMLRPLQSTRLERGEVAG
jgi:hypothetical protein